MTDPYASQPSSESAAPQQSGQPQYGQPQYGQPQYGQPQYDQSAYGQPQTYPAGPPQSTSKTLSIVSFVLSGLALLIFPIFLGAAAIICGAIAFGRKERLGKLALIVSIACTILGVIFGILVAAARN